MLLIYSFHTTVISDKLSMKMTIGYVLYIISLITQTINSFSNFGAASQQNFEIDASGGDGDDNNDHAFLLLDPTNQYSIDKNQNQQQQTAATTASEVSNTELDLQIAINMISFILLDDKEDYLLPLFSSKIVDMDYQLSGSGFNLNGQGGTGFSLDYYNFNIGAWEPVIESFILSSDLKIKKDSTSVEVIFIN